jgi:hypothetical protein
MKPNLKLGARIYYTSMWDKDTTIEGVVTDILEDRIMVRWAFYTTPSKHMRNDTRFWEQTAFCCHTETV